MTTYYPVTVRTYAIYADGSHMDERFGTLKVYAQGEDRSNAEDNVRDWLYALGDAGRVYTAEGKPRRILGSVESDPYDTPAVTRVPKGKFTIIPEPAS